MRFYILTLTFGIELLSLVSGQSGNGFRRTGSTSGNAGAQSWANGGDSTTVPSTDERQTIESTMQEIADGTTTPTATSSIEMQQTKILLTTAMLQADETSVNTELSDRSTKDSSTVITTYYTNDVTSSIDSSTPKNETIQNSSMPEAELTKMPHRRRPGKGHRHRRRPGRRYPRRRRPGSHGRRPWRRSPNGRPWRRDPNGRPWRRDPNGRPWRRDPRGRPWRRNPNGRWPGRTTAMLQDDTANENTMRTETAYSSSHSNFESDASESNTSEKAKATSAEIYNKPTTEVTNTNFEVQTTTKLSDVSNAEVSTEMKNISSYQSISTTEERYSETNTQSMTRSASTYTSDSSTEDIFESFTATMSSDQQSSVPTTTAIPSSTATYYNEPSSVAQSSADERENDVESTIGTTPGTYIQPTTRTTPDINTQLTTVTTQDTDIKPTTQTTSDADTQPITVITQDTDTQKTTNTTPDTDIPPTTETTLDTDIPPTIETTQHTDIPPTTDTTLNTNIQSTTNTIPNTDVQPTRGTTLKTDIQPTTDTIASTDVPPTSPSDVAPATNTSPESPIIPSDSIASSSTFVSTSIVTDGHTELYTTVYDSSTTPGGTKASESNPSEAQPEESITKETEIDSSSQVLDHLTPKAESSTEKDFGTENTSKGFTDVSDASNSETKDSTNDENKTKGNTEGSVSETTESTKTKATENTVDTDEKSEETDSEVTSAKSYECKDDKIWWECKPLLHTTCKTFALAEAKDSECIPGCFCEDGFILTDDEKCVEPYNCPTPVCTEIESATDCMNPCNTCEANCQQRCDVLGDCVPGCDCLDGFKRNSTGSCVHPSKCPPCEI